MKRNSNKTITLSTGRDVPHNKLGFPKKLSNLTNAELLSYLTHFTPVTQRRISAALRELLNTEEHWVLCDLQLTIKTPAVSVGLQEVADMFTNLLNSVKIPHYVSQSDPSKKPEQTGLAELVDWLIELGLRDSAAISKGLQRLVVDQDIRPRNFHRAFFNAVDAFMEYLNARDHEELLQCSREIGIPESEIFGGGARWDMLHLTRIRNMHRQWMAKLIATQMFSEYLGITSPKHT